MAYIDKINKNSVDYDLRDSKAARSVNGTTDSHVEEANQIYTTTGVAQTEYFTYRTTAGDASINSGPATLVKIIGNTVQTGHTDEVLDVAGQFEDSSTSVAINKATWETTVTTDGTYIFYYDGENWKLSDATVTLATYGLTVTGAVAEGDDITVTYVKLVIGTLATTKPTGFVATGFNQYDATAGYAHVIGDNQYRIAGTYTSLGFATTVGGTTTPVTVTNGKFTPAEDGYIYVTGGVGDILIALVWSGSRDSDPYEAYSTSTVTIPTADASSTALPIASYGMPSVGSVADELSFSDKKYYQRIGHYTYSSANLATVEAMGVEYVYDLNDIFYVLSEPIIFTLADTVDGTYTANDYGTEEFTGTSTSAGASLYYGNNLVDKLRNLADIQTIGTGLTLTNGELTAGGGGSAYNVYSTKTTSNSNRGGAIYLGNLNSSQEQFQDPTTSDAHARYIHVLPYSNTTKPSSNSIILGSELTSTTATGVIGIGFSASTEGAGVINIGGQYGRGQYSVIIGSSASNQRSDSQYNVLLGYSSKIDAVAVSGSVGIGAYSRPTLSGQIHVGSTNTSFGYNNTNYRIISGVHDGQDLNDAATVAQGNTLATTAPTTSTAGVLGQLYTDTTTMHTYQCTDTTGGVYTWTQRW